MKCEIKNERGNKVKTEIIRTFFAKINDVPFYDEKEFLLVSETMSTLEKRFEKSILDEYIVLELSMYFSNKLWDEGVTSSTLLSCIRVYARESKDIEEFLMRLKPVKEYREYLTKISKGA